MNSGGDPEEPDGPEATESELAFGGNSDDGDDGDDSVDAEHEPVSPVKRLKNRVMSIVVTNRLGELQQAAAVERVRGREQERRRHKQHEVKLDMTNMLLHNDGPGRLEMQPAFATNINSAAKSIQRWWRDHLRYRKWRTMIELLKDDTHAPLLTRTPWGGWQVNNDMFSKKPPLGGIPPSASFLDFVYNEGGNGATATEFDMPAGSGAGGTAAGTAAGKAAATSGNAGRAPNGPSNASSRTWQLKHRRESYNVGARHWQPGGSTRSMGRSVEGGGVGCSEAHDKQRVIGFGGTARFPQAAPPGNAALPSLKLNKENAHKVWPGRNSLASQLTERARQEAEAAAKQEAAARAAAEAYLLREPDERPPALSVAATQPAPSFAALATPPLESRYSAHAADTPPPEVATASETGPTMDVGVEGAPPAEGGAVRLGEAEGHGIAKLMEEDAAQGRDGDAGCGAAGAGAEGAEGGGGGGSFDATSAGSEPRNATTSIWPQYEPSLSLNNINAPLAPLASHSRRDLEPRGHGGPVLARRASGVAVRQSGGAGAAGLAEAAARLDVEGLLQPPIERVSSTPSMLLLKTKSMQRRAPATSAAGAGIAASAASLRWKHAVSRVGSRSLQRKMAPPQRMRHSASDSGALSALGSAGSSVTSLPQLLDAGKPAVRPGKQSSASCREGTGLPPLL